MKEWQKPGWIGLSRSRPPESWEDDLKALNTTKFYLINRLGPLLFCLKADSQENIYKVWVGSPQHKCSCGGGGDTHCIHINFVLLKILRLATTDPLSWKPRLSEDDINKILDGNHTNSSIQGCPKRVDFLRKGAGLNPKAKPCDEVSNDAPHQTALGTVARKTLDEEDRCPICQENLTDLEFQDNQLHYCDNGCGSNFHLKCLRVLQAYARSQKKNAAPHLRYRIV
jgi:hypothetical protein